MQNSGKTQGDAGENKGGEVISIFSHQDFVTRIIRRRQYQLPIINDATLAMYPALIFAGPLHQSFFGS